MLNISGYHLFGYFAYCYTKNSRAPTDVFPSIVSEGAETLVGLTGNYAPLYISKFRSATGPVDMICANEYVLCLHDHLIS